MGFHSTCVASILRRDVTGAEDHIVVADYIQDLVDRGIETAAIINTNGTAASGHVICIHGWHINYPCSVLCRHADGLRIESADRAVEDDRADSVQPGKEPADQISPPCRVKIVRFDHKSFHAGGLVRRGQIQIVHPAVNDIGSSVDMHIIGAF